MKTVECPHCHKPIAAGQLLGRMGRGKGRRFSPETLAQLKDRLAAGRQKLEAARAQKAKDAFTQLNACNSAPLGHS